MKKFSKLIAIGLASFIIVGVSFSQASEAKTSTLQDLYNEENLAYANYKKASEQFNQARPFINIMKSEERHMKLLEFLSEKENQTLTKEKIVVEDFKDYKDAIDKAIALEKGDIDSLETMLKNKDLTDEAKSILEKLLKASQNHLDKLNIIAENDYEPPISKRDGKGQQNFNKNKGNTVAGREKNQARSAKQASLINNCPYSELGNARQKNQSRKSGLGKQIKWQSYRKDLEEGKQ